MNEQMKVGVAIELKGDATPKLKSFQLNVDKLTKTVEALNTKLGATGKLLNFLNGPLEKLVTSMQGLGAAAAISSRSFTGLNRSLGNADARMGKAATQAARLREELHGVAAAGEAAAAGLSGVRGGGAAGGGGGGHGRGIHARGFHIGPYGIGAAAFGTPGLAALGVGYLGYKSYTAQGNFQQAQAQLAAQGFGDAANQRAVSAALRMNIKGVSTTEALQAINDASTVTRNIDSAIALAPLVAKMEYANKVTYRARGKDFTAADEMRMLQFAELRTGSTDPKLISKTLNQIEQAYSTDAARLSTNDLRTMSRQGASFIEMLSDAGFIKALPLVQSMGGQRLATGLTTMQTSLFKGQNLRTGKRAAAELERLGIYKNGRLDPKYADIVSQDPIGFIHDILLPSMAKKGITSQGQIAQELGIILTQSVNRVIQQVIAQWPRIQAQTTMFPNASDVQGVYVKALNLNPGRIEALEKSWDSLLTAMGRLNSPAVSSGIDKLTNMLNGLANLMNRQSVSDNKISTVLNAPKNLLLGNGDTNIPGYGEVLKDDWQAIKNYFSKKNSSDRQVVNVNVDGRALLQVILPELDKANYQAMVTSTNRFNSSIGSTPSVPGTPHSF